MNFYGESKRASVVIDQRYFFSKERYAGPNPERTDDLDPDFKPVPTGKAKTWGFFLW